MSTNTTNLAAAVARLGPRARGFRLAQAACIVGLLFAAVSVYRVVGGTGSASVILALWAGAVLEMIAAVLPLLALQRPDHSTWDRNALGLAWLAAGILTVFGLVLTAGGLLIWGLLAAAALLRGRTTVAQAPTLG